MLAHIAGIPVEETALNLVPIAAATGGIAALKLRERLRRQARAARRGPGQRPALGRERR